MKIEKRYIVFSKNAFGRTGVLKSVKNAVTRQEARDFKNSQVNPKAFAIWDKQSQDIIH